MLLSVRLLLCCRSAVRTWFERSNRPLLFCCSNEVLKCRKRARSTMATLLSVPATMLLSRSVRSVVRCTSRCDSRPLSSLATRPASPHVAPRAVTCAWSASSGPTSTRTCASSSTSRRTHAHPTYSPRTSISVPVVGIQPFSTKSDTSNCNNKDEEDGAASPPPPSPPSFAETILRGTGQVIFLNSSTSGALILGGLAVADPYLATMALAGVTTSTLAASMGGLDRQARNDGLYGYNGALVGCAVSVFLHPLPATAMATMDLQTLAASPDVINSVSWALASTIMGASIAPYVSVGLKEAMGGGASVDCCIQFDCARSIASDQTAGCGSRRRIWCSISRSGDGFV
mmetsp:Transcript_851/g.2360  ORF Transcript_851/g.2360 Transcript_851/m.2360 type:complete len:344 (-) Transcript_851:358-1389(-)